MNDQANETYLEPMAGPRFTVTRHALLVDAEGAKILTGQLTWEDIDRLRAELEAKHNHRAGEQRIPDRLRIAVEPPVVGLVGPTNPQRLIADFIRNVAEEANDAGLRGQKLVGIGLDNQSGPIPRAELVVEPKFEAFGPLSAETRAGIAEGLADIAARRTISLADYKRQRRLGCLTCLDDKKLCNCGLPPLA